MKAHAGKNAVVITEDGIFAKRQPALERYARERGVSLDFWKLADAENRLRNMLDANVKDRVQRHIKLATRAIEAALPALDEAFNPRLESTRRDRRLTRDILSDVHFGRVTNVDVPVLNGEPEPGTEIRIAAVLTGTVQVVRFIESATGDVEVPRGRQPIEISASLLATFDGHSYRDVKMRVSMYQWLSSP